MSGWQEIVGEARWDATGLHVELHDPVRRSLSVDGGLLVVGEASEVKATALLRDLLAARRPAHAIAGSFAAVAVDTTRQTLLLAADAFGMRALYYWSDGERVVFATRLSAVARVARLRPALDWSAVYHYLNFTYVPGPGTIFADVWVLPPGSVARCTRGKVEVETYWDMTYPADATEPEHELGRILRAEIECAIRTSWLGVTASEAGCFLSGGTDSGTVAGILSGFGRPLNAYSIAFTENAFDELEYAKMVAARHALAHHVHRLTAGDLLDSIGPILADSDQPFGNPSTIATWRCARLARETGVTTLFAGDGGDELFGGNERYAKDYLYRLYHHLPAALRRGLVDLVGGLPARGLVWNRVRNIAERGHLPNPDRLYADDALASRRWEELVSAGLRARVQRDASVEVMREHWRRVEATSEIDRLMYVDLKTAIWGNDLVKVVSAARAAGVRVRFPLLDPTLGEFTGRLDATMKVRRREKRYLFKRAVADLLPAAVLSKTKHGFGVPVGEWVRTDARVRDAVLGPVLDPRSIVRDCFTEAGLAALIGEHQRAEWDHGAWLWALMMLARWHAAWRSASA
jgi:asparagine synthase (glutamine-hydrolysing)